MSWWPISSCCCPGTDSSYFLLALLEQPPTWALWLLAHFSLLHPPCFGQWVHFGMQIESWLKSFRSRYSQPGNVPDVLGGFMPLTFLFLSFLFQFLSFWNLKYEFQNDLKNSHLLKLKHLLPLWAGMCRGQWGGGGGEGQLSIHSLSWESRRTLVHTMGVLAVTRL